MDAYREEEERRWLEKVNAFIGLLFVAALVAFIGYHGVTWLWPSGITDVALSSLTLGMLLRAAGACFIGLIAGVVVFMLISVLFE